MAEKLASERGVETASPPGSVHGAGWTSALEDPPHFAERHLGHPPAGLAGGASEMGEKGDVVPRNELRLEALRSMC